MGPDTIWVLIPLAALFIPIAAILTKHLQRLAEIKAQAGANISNEVRAELENLKAQIIQLRDTTTKFDVAFDTALDRIEQRLDASDARKGTAATTATAVPANAEPGGSSDAWYQKVQAVAPPDENIVVGRR